MNSEIIYILTFCKIGTIMTGVFEEENKTIKKGTSSQLTLIFSHI